MSDKAKAKARKLEKKTRSQLQGIALTMGFDPTEIDSYATKKQLAAAIAEEVVKQETAEVAEPAKVEEPVVEPVVEPVKEVVIEAVAKPVAEAVVASEASFSKELTKAAKAQAGEAKKAKKTKKAKKEKGPSKTHVKNMKIKMAMAQLTKDLLTDLPGIEAADEGQWIVNAELLGSRYALVKTYGRDRNAWRGNGNRNEDGTWEGHRHPAARFLLEMGFETELVKGEGGWKLKVTTLESFMGNIAEANKQEEAAA